MNNIFTQKDVESVVRSVLKEAAVYRRANAKSI